MMDFNPPDKELSTPTTTGALAIERRNNNHTLQEDCIKVEVRKEAKLQFKLAGPLIAVSILQYCLQVISLIFVGHLGKKLELAGASLATSFAAVSGFNVLLGLSSALETLCGQAYGAKQYHKLGIHTQHAMIVLLTSCVPVAVMWLFTGNILMLIGQNHEIAIEAGKFIRPMIPSLFAYSLLQCLTRFLQTQNVVIHMMITSGFTATLHVLVCWIFVFRFGFGMEGAAWANTFSYWVNVILLGIYVKCSPKFSETWLGFSKVVCNDILAFLKLALPSACMICLEYWSFQLIVILSGLLPNPQLETSVLSISSLQLKVKKLKEERETNSDLKKEDVNTDEKTIKPNSESVEPVSDEPVRDDSCNGSSDSVGKKPVGEPVEPVKESSDLQSSARECGNDVDEDLTVERGLIRSQSLVSVLEMVRSHKVASAFERQEIRDHQNPIRQPIDIETISARLEEGCYSDCKNKFFRDLLLLFNNATFFFKKSSPEFTAAIELRKFISSEICQRSKKPDLSTISSKPDSEPLDSLILKPKILRPIIVCRKRSSIASKMSGSSSGEEKKKVQNAALLDDKPLLGWKQASKFSANAEETENTKKRTSDRFVSSSKSSKKNGKNQTSPEQTSVENQAKGSTPKEQHIELKSNKKSPNLTTGKKRNTTSGNKNKHKTSTLLESLKDLETSPAETEKLSGSNGRGERKREPKGKPVKERESPIKRNNGRVGKKAVAPPPVAVAGKRTRERWDADVAASTQPKKRSRR